MGKRGIGKNFMIHGMILGAASIISRLIGLVYRIPLNNILGSEALSDYSNAYNVYSFMLLLSSLSVPLAVSKMVSARCANKEYRTSYMIFKNALVFSFSIGLIFGLLTYFGAEFIAGILGYGEGITPALRALSPALVVMSVLGVFRGYFQGLGTMIPTAFSNILEQIVNAVVSIVAAIYLIGYGKKLYEMNEIKESMIGSYGAAGGTMGTVFGALIALAFLFYIFLIYKKTIKKQIRNDKFSKEERKSDLIKILIITILPVILSTTIYNVSSIIDSALFGNIMEIKGFSVSERKIMYGSFSGYYILLINVPVSIAAALASSTVPAVVSSFSRNSIGEVFKKTESAIKLAMIIAIPCAAGYFALSKPIITLLFRSCDNIDLVSNMLKMGCLTVVFYSLSTITGGILQGINKMKVPVINSAISLVIHIVMLVIGLYFFDFNIYTLVVMDMIFALIICVLNIYSINEHLGFKPEILKTFVMPFSSAIIMGAAGYGINNLLNKINIPDSFSCIIAILICIFVYGVLLLVFKVIDENEIRALPMGGKIVVIAKKVRLL